MNQRFILPLGAGQANLALAGGKAMNLARLVQANFPVPGGFLLTTAAYQSYVQANDLAAVIRDTLIVLPADDPVELASAARTIRAFFATGTIPPAVAQAIEAAYANLNQPAVAVRSSATAEDLPDLSFAGQQDTYLNVVGIEALLEAVVNCWSSLWTARAMGYRARNAIAHEEVALAVVVQEMVQSEASGVLFTANPLNGRRTEMVIDATLGLGEALVAGLVEPDHYVVAATNGRILDKTLGAKAIAIHSQAGGGTVTLTKDAARRQALPDSAISELAQLGRQVADLFSTPQDIEWAWAAGQLYLLQSRPITSLYPLPAGITEAGPTPLQTLFSFGAVQGMLDPMTPLGQDSIKSAFAGAARLFGYEVTAETQRVIWTAGERLFVNITSLVRHPMGRRLLRQALPQLEPGVSQALATLWQDDRLAPGPGWFKFTTLWRVGRVLTPIAGRFAGYLRHPEAKRIQLQRWIEATVAGYAVRSQRATTLEERLVLLEDMLKQGFPTAVTHVAPAIIAGIVPLALLHRLAAHLPGEKTDVLLLTRGMPHNVTTEMDLALWETARAIKEDPAAAAHYEANTAAGLAADFQAGRLPAVAQAAVAAFLARYGMRGLAEIDLGRPRWREDPTPVMQALQSYLRIEDPKQAPDAVFQRGAIAAQVAIEELVAAARRTRGGRLKARLVRGAASRLRALAGLRESPKFFIIRLFGLAREGLLAAGRQLADAGVLAQPDDVFFLRLAELKALARDIKHKQAGQRDWQEVVARRRQVYTREQQRRQIPRLLLSDGQAFYQGLSATAGDREDVLVGSPVSPGVAEGRVHVVLDPGGVQLAPGEILVCPGTDPSWTPLFLAAGGLIMEVGGLMTHGSVVAREYGIPAVVGVYQATTRLKTGQRVRVDGSAGQIMILDKESGNNR